MNNILKYFSLEGKKKYVEVLFLISEPKNEELIVHCSVTLPIIIVKECEICSFT